MNNAPSILAIVVPSQDRRVLDADLLGKPAGQYLLDTLRACPGVEVAPAGETDRDRISLIVDERVWMSAAVAAGFVERARLSAGGFRVVRRGTPAVSPDDAPTLVTCLPPPRGSSPGTVALDVHDVGAPEFELRLLESMADLAAVEAGLLAARAQDALQRGARLRDPASVRIRGDLVFGAGVEIDADVIFEGRVVLGDGVRIGAHCILRDASVGEGTRIHPFSLVEGSTIGRGGFAGPFARIRPGCAIGDRVQIGNYVEIKASAIGSGSRINHHAFIGDAELADDVTIGAGTITCNHDGVGNTRTVIEQGAYVGSGCNLVAPLRVGAGATVGAGSTITEDVPPGRLTLARSRQATIDHWRGPRQPR
jgi:acetyltransferase-like isoleucine patch superfamily enzyme